MSEMALQEAIKNLHEATEFFWMGDYDREAFRVVLSAAEKQMEDGPKAEKWDAIEWAASQKRKCVAEDGEVYDADRHPNAADIVCATNYYHTLYRKAKEGEK